MGNLFTRQEFRVNFDQKWVGLHFGLFFHTPIWSPCLDVNFLTGDRLVIPKNFENANESSSADFHTQAIEKFLHKNLNMSFFFFRSKNVSLMVAGSSPAVPCFFWGYFSSEML
jgi:hypothetical protein